MSQLRFLIIQLRQIGDVLISTTLCETLKRNYPKAQIDYAVYDYTAAVAENNPFIDNLIIVPHGMKRGNFYKILKTISNLRKQSYDYTIDILNTPKSVWLAKLSGSKTIIGPKNDKNRSQKYDFKIDHDNHFLKDNSVCISVKNRLILLSAVSETLSYTTVYKLHLQEQETFQAKKLLQAQQIDFTKPIFFFSVGSRSPQQKQWPIDNFIQVINDCLTKYNAQIVLYPGPKQEDDCFFIKKNSVRPENIFIITNYNLREMAAIIKLSTIFIGNDSGTAHIAIAVGTPSITIFSPAIWHQDWHSKTSKQHIAITAQTILGLNDTDYDKLLINQTSKKTKELYALIKPKLVEEIINKLMHSASYT